MFLTLKSFRKFLRLSTCHCKLFLTLNCNIIFFFLFACLLNPCLPYTKRILYSEQPTVLLIWGYLNTKILTNFENLSSISNIFKETHDFLFFTDPVIICIYLRTTDRHFRDQGNVHHPTSKLLKCDLVQTFNSFLNPSMGIFTAGKASLV